MDMLKCFKNQTACNDGNMWMFYCIDLGSGSLDMADQFMVVSGLGKKTQVW